MDDEPEIRFIGEGELDGQPRSLELHGSMLTPSQREFLQFGPHEEMTDHSQTMTKSRVRKRLGAALMDFSIILGSDYLDPQDMTKALTDALDVELNPVPLDLIQEAIGVFLVGRFGGTGEAIDSEVDESIAIRRFQYDLESGIERGLTRLGYPPDDVTVNIDVDPGPDLESEDVTELHELPFEQLKRLELANQISETEFVSALVKQGQLEQEDGFSEQN